ncbi:valine--tRNA ligase [Holospora elegans E1]|uniref:valine--tRNA ligase n=1 Tax=Holospora elegans E1 TaxID=1427503 RepID=A0A023DXM9_9PROT|nr:valine--tRNA ligase [Holospora elegans E1]
MHPEDTRYKEYIGKKAYVPIVYRWVPIVADEAVDVEKGTGAVKITPAHDFLDFSIAQRHNLPCIDIFDEEGRLNDTVPKEFCTLDSLEARNLILEKLGKKVISWSSIQHSVPYSQRSGAVIQPRLTEQWFLDTAQMAKCALDIVKNGECQFFPKEWERTYEEWLKNIQPWCISRQLWWGHQIPAWYDEKGSIFVAHTKEEAELLAKTQGSSGALKQEEDVLDTWFSSGIWPFSTLGWPEKDSPLFTACYPTNVLVTGFDIIFFWVARMMMLGLELTKAPPFKHISIHPLVCDEKGKKMSKTKGNVINPMELANQYGVDALRFALTLVSTPSSYTAFGVKHVEQARNFITKLKNVGRFMELNRIHGRFDLPEKISQDMNRWVIIRITDLGERVKKSLHSYSFHEAASLIYTNIWAVVCDWYIEWAKDTLKHASKEDIQEVHHVMGWGINTMLIILHPFIPFTSQTLWEIINPTEASGAWQQDWPTLQEFQFCSPPVECIQEIITTIRRLRAEFKISFICPIELHIYTGGDREILTHHKNFIERITHTVCKIFDGHPPCSSKGLSVHLGEVTVIFLLQHLLDIEKELERLEKNYLKIKTQLDEWENRLSCQEFCTKALPNVVHSLEERCKQNKIILNRIEQDLLMLKAVDNSL